MRKVLTLNQSIPGNVTIPTRAWQSNYHLRFSFLKELKTCQVTGRCSRSSVDINSVAHGLIL